MAEPKIETLREPLTGGCQCGAVRYTVDMQPVGAHFCHCRMCQRAVGNVFASLAPVLKTRLQWLTRPPQFFKSSTAAQRGFCEKCGTPLTFAYNRSKWICVTTGSLDEPARVPPTIHYGIESQVHWLHLHEELPREETGVTDELRNMTVFQHQPSAHG